MAGKTCLLDIGCRTGNKTAALAERLKESHFHAFDTHAPMIELARRKYGALAIDFSVQNMRRIAQTYVPGCFDAVLCLGNVFAHLAKPYELLQVLRQIRVILEEGGVLIGEIANFDRILNQSIGELPPIEARQCSLSRSYVWRDMQMFLVRELSIKGGQTYHQEIPVRPIIKSVLGGALDQAGFGAVEYYGNFAGEPYDMDSDHMIFLAHTWRRESGG